MKRLILTTLTLIALSLVIASCAGISGTSVSWKQTPLKDVVTGDTFQLSDFAGKVTVVELAIVSCTVCKSQQIEIAAARESVPDVVFITLDIDPNESEAALRDHMEQLGFDWHAALLAPAQSRQLEAQFGSGILNLTSSPVIILDKDQNPYLLKSGLKSVDFLISEISKYR